MAGHRRRREGSARAVSLVVAAVSCRTRMRIGHHQTKTSYGAIRRVLRLLVVGRAGRRAHGRDSVAVFVGVGGCRGSILVGNPSIPEEPAQHRRHASPADDGDGRDSVLEDADETADKDGDGSDVLDDHGRVGNKRPELVGLESRVPLQMIKERRGVGVVVRIYSVDVSGHLYDTEVCLVAPHRTA